MKKKTEVKARVTTELKEEFKKALEKDNRTCSLVLTSLIKQYIANVDKESHLKKQVT